MIKISIVIRAILLFLLLFNFSDLTGKDLSSKTRLGKTMGPVISIDEAIGIINAGKLQHSFGNNGELGSIRGFDLPSLLQLPAAFYKGYGYLPDLFMMIGVPEGPWSMLPNALGDTVSWGPTVSEYNVGGDFGPTAGSKGLLHSGKVTIGDVASAGPFDDTPLIATSDKPGSWPASGWPGPWRKIILEDGRDSVIVGQFTGDQEAYFSTNDFDLNNNDRKYSEADDETNQGFSLGIQFDIHVIGYGRSYAEDIIFYPMNVINTSKWNYTGVYLGFYCDVDAPEYNRSTIINHREDWMAYLARETEDDTTFQYNMSYIFDQESDPYDGPGPIAYTAIKLLETPGAEFDGIDNDQDGVIDEGSDGIDNDGDGEIDENDLSERDMLGLTDWHWFRWENRPGEIDGLIQEYEQWKLLSGGSRATLWSETLNDWGPFITNTNSSFNKFKSDTMSDGRILTLTSKHNEDDAWFHPDEDNNLDPHFDDFTIFEREDWDDLDAVYISSSGPFTLPPLDTTTISFALIMGDNLEDLKRNARTAQLMYNKNYLGADPPALPTLTAVPDDKKVTLYWDGLSELSKDIITDVQDFEGYRLYRSLVDPTIDDWGELIKDSEGNEVGTIPIAQWDIPNNNIKDQDGNAPHLYLGDDEIGLSHMFVDEDLINGQTYWYSITAYDRGIDDRRNVEGNIIDSLAATGVANLESLESAKGNNADAATNLVKVIPGVKPKDWIKPEGEESIFPKPDIAGKGTININLIDPEKVIDATYTIVFHDTVITGVLHYDVIDSATGEYMITLSNDTKGGDASKVFNGIHLTIENSEKLNFTGVRTPDAVYRDMVWLQTSSDTAKLAVDGLEIFGFSDNALGIPADYVVEFVDSADGTLKYPDYSALPPTFNEHKIHIKVYNSVTDPERTNPLPLYVGASSDFGKPWSSGEVIAIFDPGFEPTLRFNSKNVNWSFMISWGDTIPIDSSVTPPTPEYITQLPQKGDVLRLRTYKAFLEGDIFTFSTTSASINMEKADNLLSDVKVVPNPFVAWNEWQFDGGLHRVSFINLPEKCKIYIYTVAGDLVKILEHDERFSGETFWNLLNESNQTIAYGLYVYVVETAGGKSKIGKFAIIK